MQQFSHHSARVTCQILASGAGIVIFSGVLTHKGFGFLRAHACRAVHDAVALVVPSERYEQALALARKMASTFGVRRPVFLPGQIDAAHQWAAHVARSHSAKSPQPQP